MNFAGKIEFYKANPFPVYEVRFYDWAPEMGEEWGDHDDDYYIINPENTDTMMDDYDIPVPENSYVEITQCRSGIITLDGGEVIDADVDACGATIFTGYFNEDGEEVDPYLEEDED